MSKEKSRANTDPRAVPGESAIVSWAKVKLTKVELGPVEVVEFGLPAASDKPYLKLTLSLTTANPKKAWEFPGWLDTPDLLRDGEGNKYRTPDFGFTSKVTGALGTDRITSDRPLTGMLVFDTPPPGVTELRLDLPSHGVEEKNFFRFRIPASAWKK